MAKAEGDRCLFQRGVMFVGEVVNFQRGGFLEAGVIGFLGIRDRNVKTILE